MVSFLVISASDLPKLCPTDSVIEYEPGQRGHFKARNDIEAGFCIYGVAGNRVMKAAKGWVTKTPFAIAGCFCMEALQVDFGTAYGRVREYWLDSIASTK